jgi:zinc/manganese transport system substrate-binding protein
MLVAPMLVLGIAVSVCLSVAACGSVSPAGDSGGRLRVVAAENFWGSIAAQLGGKEVAIQSIIVNPETDPHGYEPTAEDARSMAGAQMAIVNGIGYDEWASHLLAADPSSGRTVLDVGKLLGLERGENPHQWYSPAHVRTVIARITADYDKLRPADASYFDGRRKEFESRELARYRVLIGQIRARYRGVPVGYSESIFQPLGQALGLTLLTPYSFAKAIAEGAEVTARDRQVVDGQAQLGQIKVWVLNSQNIAPDVQRVDQLARAAHIPIVTLTETLSPASASFEQWQVAQLERLERALHAATGRCALPRSSCVAPARASEPAPLRRCGVRSTWRLAPANSWPCWDPTGAASPHCSRRYSASCTRPPAR